jgi:cytochrome c-type biogenesis protein CcmE
MKPHRRNQLFLVLFILAGGGSAMTLALMALNENINLFYEPEQIASGEAPVDQMIRAGGMVKEGSITRSKTDLKITFVVTDLRESEFTIQYEGLLPDLFREV